MPRVQGSWQTDAPDGHRINARRIRARGLNGSSIAVQLPLCRLTGLQGCHASFRNALRDEDMYAEILRTTSVEQVYDLTDKLQAEQGRTNDMRNLAKLQMFLKRLNGYARAVETFVQVKPDVLALIWGPIKLLIQWSSTVSKALGSLIDTASEIGMLLPEFGQALRIFARNDET